jgi:hypothetical protein
VKVDVADVAEVIAMADVATKVAEDIVINHIKEDASTSSF